MSITLDGTTGIVAPAIDVATPITVSDGGTGASTLTSNNVILGAGTSAVTFVAPGSSGNVLTSDGTTWASAAAGGGAFRTHKLSSGTTYTPQAKVKSFYVFVYGSTGGRVATQTTSGGAGGPGYSEKYYASPSGSYTYAIGAGGTTGGTQGGATTFGGVISVAGTIGQPGQSQTGRAGAAGSGGDFNATGGTGGNGSNGAAGGGGGAGTRAGDGGNGANAPSNALAGGSGGTGGNNGSGGTGGAAATVKAVGALDLSTTLGTITESWQAGITATTTAGQRGASSDQAQDLSFIWDTFSNHSGSGTTAQVGLPGGIVIIELL